MFNIFIFWCDRKLVPSTYLDFHYHFHYRYSVSSALLYSGVTLNHTSPLTRYYNNKTGYCDCTADVYKRQMLRCSIRGTTSLATLIRRINLLQCRCTCIEGFEYSWVAHNSGQLSVSITIKAKILCHQIKVFSCASISRAFLKFYLFSADYCYQFIQYN